MVSAFIATQSGAVITRSNIAHPQKYFTSRPETEHQSAAEYTKNTPYIALTGELWGVFCEHFDMTDRVITAQHCMYITLGDSYITTVIVKLECCLYAELVPF